MDKKRILIIERSQIIRQGITAILRGQSYQYEVIGMTDYRMAQEYFKAHRLSVVLINPSAHDDNNGEELKELRQDAINFGFKMVAVVYSYVDEPLLSLFDEAIFINDEEKEILAKLHGLAFNSHPKNNMEGNATLSQREIEVIRLIALGHSNREIGDELHISVHTVISHRKNITSKLGIKSASGLTIYAVINKLISSTDFDKTI